MNHKIVFKKTTSDNERIKYMKLCYHFTNKDQLESILSEKLFEYPKPVSLIKYLISIIQTMILIY